MPLVTKVLISLVSFFVLVTIIYLVRKKYLDEKYALLWLIAGLLMITAPFSINLIDAFSTILGIHYPPAFIFLICFFVLCLINLQFSVAISRLSKQNKILAQRYALLEQQVRSRT